MSTVKGLLIRLILTVTHMERCLTLSIPLNNPYSSPLYNSLCNHHSLDHGSHGVCGLGVSNPKRCGFRHGT